MITYSGNPLFAIKLSHGRRGEKGTKVWVKADPLVVDFIRSLGDGSYKDLPMGYMIYPITPLVLQSSAFGNGDIRVPDFDGYTLDHFRGGLLLDDERTVNLSFLRFKGLEEGVTFGLRAIYSLATMKELKHLITQACRSLCRDFIVPASVKLVIVGDTES